MVSKGLKVFLVFVDKQARRTFTSDSIPFFHVIIQVNIVIVQSGGTLKVGISLIKFDDECTLCLILVKMALILCVIDVCLMYV